MNVSDLREAVAEQTGLDPEQVRETIEATLAVIMAAVASGQRVRLTGFGTFEPRPRAARTARHPQTGEPTQLAASTTPAFTAGATFKRTVTEVARW